MEFNFTSHFWHQIEIADIFVLWRWDELTQTGRNNGQERRIISTLLFLSSTLEMICIPPPIFFFFLSAWRVLPSSTRPLVSCPPQNTCPAFWESDQRLMYRKEGLAFHPQCFYLFENWLFVSCWVFSDQDNVGVKFLLLTGPCCQWWEPWLSVQLSGIMAVARRHLREAAFPHTSISWFTPQDLLLKKPLPVNFV